MLVSEERKFALFFAATILVALVEASATGNLQRAEQLAFGAEVKEDDGGGDAKAAVRGCVIPDVVRIAQIGGFSVIARVAASDRHGGRGRAAGRRGELAHSLWQALGS